jgi:ABC-2 type transport system permease protein
MTLIGTEILKLRTIRSPWILLAVGQLLIVIGASGPLARGDTSRTAAAGAVAHIGLTSLVALVFGIVCVAGEYRHRTIVDAYLTTPRRDRVIAAKVAVSTAAGVGFAVVGTATALLTTVAWMTVHGGTVAWSDAELWRIIGGDIAWNAAFAAIGAGLGALMRNVTAAIAAALAWLALVEGLVGRLLGDDLGRWLPFSSGSALGRLPTVVDDGLSQATAAAVLAAYAVAFTAVALGVTVRRDLT